MDPLLLGIDIGTTNIKAIVFDPQGKTVASTSVKTPTHYPRPNWAYYVPDEIWTQTVTAIKQTVSQIDQPQRIVSVAVTSMAESAVPIDAQGQPTYDSIAWFDTRTEPQQRWLDEHIGHRRRRLGAVDGFAAAFGRTSEPAAACSRNPNPKLVLRPPRRSSSAKRVPHCAGILEDISKRSDPPAPFPWAPH